MKFIWVLRENIFPKKHNEMMNIFYDFLGNCWNFRNIFPYINFLCNFVTNNFQCFFVLQLFQFFRTILPVDVVLLLECFVDFQLISHGNLFTNIIIELVFQKIWSNILHVRILNTFIFYIYRYTFIYMFVWHSHQGYTNNKI